MLGALALALNALDLQARPVDRLLKGIERLPVHLLLLAPLLPARQPRGSHRNLRSRGGAQPRAPRCALPLESALGHRGPVRAVLSTEFVLKHLHPPMARGRGPSTGARHDEALPTTLLGARGDCGRGCGTCARRRPGIALSLFCGRPVAASCFCRMARAQVCSHPRPRGRHRIHFLRVQCRADAALRHLSSSHEVCVHGRVPLPCEVGAFDMILVSRAPSTLVRPAHSRPVRLLILLHVEHPFSVCESF